VSDGSGGMLTSGKVPFEKTLCGRGSQFGPPSSRHVDRRYLERDAHEQAGLSAGTVADDDELASQFGHGSRSCV
jgi:hypothetical protein